MADGDAVGLLVGGTGQLGGAVAQVLDMQGLRFRLLARTLARAPAGLAHAAIVAGDLAQPDGLAAALADCSWLVIVPPDGPAMPGLIAGLFDAARAASVRRIVKVSARLAREDPPESFGIEHAAADAHLRRCGADWTVLRPSFFMQSFAMFAEPMRNLRRIPLPCGAGRVAFIDIGDIAAAVVHCLDAPDTIGQSYTLTGPRAVGFEEAAQRIGTAAGKPLAYRPLPPLLFGWLLRFGAGLDGWTVLRLKQLCAAVTLGKEAEVTGDLERLLGRPGRDFADYATAEGACLLAQD